MKNKRGQSACSPYIWDNIWTETKDDEEFWWWFCREREGVRGRKIISYIEKFLGEMSGLKTIEIGSGAGVYSLIFAQYGSSVTLLDYSEKALILARKHFDLIRLSASYLFADALNLHQNLWGKFDVAMSFGTIEHYRYPERLLMAKAHLDLVRPGGVVIISVPNRRFFPHEVLKFCLQLRDKWQLGYEGAFRRQELFQLGTRLGLENIKVQGSALITDIFRYLHIFQGTRFFRRFYQIRSKPASPRDLPSPFDNLFGADIFLMGRKPCVMQSK